MATLGDMDRRRLLRGWMWVALIAVVLVATVVFKVRVAVAGAKYVLIIVVVIAVVALLLRRQQDRE